MDYENEDKNQLKTLKDNPQVKPSQKERSGSNCTDYANQTTRIFKRYYMPTSDKANNLFFNQPNSTDQKYIYINGKRT